MQIRLYLHPLKAKIMCQFPGHVMAPPQPQPVAPQAAEALVKQELVLEAAVPAGGVPRQASSLSEEALSTTTAPSEQSDDGLDELDFECFERALLDDTQPPRCVCRVGVVCVLGSGGSLGSAPPDGGRV
jgi:hypothetical protein